VEELALLAALVPDRFSPATLLFGIPAAAMILLAILPQHAISSLVNSAACAANLASAILFVFSPAQAGPLLLLDGFSLLFLILAHFLFFMISLYNIGYFGLARAQKKQQRRRWVHVLFQACAFSTSITLTANNAFFFWMGVCALFFLALLWLGQEKTTAPEDISEGDQALQSLLPLFGLFALLSLCGIFLLFASSHDVGMASSSLSHATSALSRLMGMTFTELLTTAPLLSAPLLEVAWVCLLIGFGGFAGLLPLQHWTARWSSLATPVLSGLCLAVFLPMSFYGLLRVKMILTAHQGETGPTALFANHSLLMMGLCLVLPLALSLPRESHIQRLIARVGVLQWGLCAIAFGVGGTALNFAALLHMLFSMVVLASLVLLVGHLVQSQGQTSLFAFRGFLQKDATAAWTTLVLLLALGGLPPFALFLSVFLLVTISFATAAWVGLLCASVILLTMGGMLFHFQHLLVSFHEDGPPQQKALELSPARSFWGRLFIFGPLALPVLLVLLSGLALPDIVVVWLQTMAQGL